MNKSDEMKGKLETYIDKDGNLVAWRPDSNIDWERLSEMPEQDALAELFAYQTAHGYEWLLPADFGGYLFSPILGWNVERDEHGKYISAERIYRFCGFRIIDALRKIAPGRGIIFHRVK
ncbi:MAG TPA: hypothetical protein PKK59_06850 [Anaerolineaceae bacterium]|nr:hypothetical protein [Anaerolineaceae bacterium]